MDQLTHRSDLLEHLLSYVDGTDLIECSKVCRSWYAVCLSENLWLKRCRIEWKLFAPTSPPRLKLLSEKASDVDSNFHDGQHLTMFRQAWQAWYSEYKSFLKPFSCARSEEEGQLFARSANCWKVIYDYSARHSIQFNLRHPLEVIPDDVPADLRALWAFHDGQAFYRSSRFYDKK